MNNIQKIREMIINNKGVITTKEVENLNISRGYLSILVKNNEIEKARKGVYIDKNMIEDEYYIFQLNCSKAIFSHMTALFFHGISERTPSRFDITVPRNYNSNKLKKENVFYVKTDILNLGLIEMKTPYGFNIKTYNMERSICDIIKSKRRMDEELVKKCVRIYLKRKDKKLEVLSEYAKKMKISKKVISYVSMLDE